MNIHIFNSVQFKYYNLTAYLNDEAVSFLTNNSIVINEEIDLEILDRLHVSLSIFVQIQNNLFENSASNANANSNDGVATTFAIGDANTSPNLSFVQIAVDGGGGGGSSSSSNAPTIENGNLNIIETNNNKHNEAEINYDNYMDNDGIIHNYVEDYFGKNYNSANEITDDAIVQIIPKELFFSVGRHLYIGREYGFFVYTAVDSLNFNDFCTDVFVFDILNEKPDFEEDVFEGTVRVTPIFQYRYRAVDREKRNNLWDGYDSSLTRVVYRHLHYDAPNYYLNNISFRHSLENVMELNYGDSNYNPNNDNGAFIIQTRLNYKGVGLKKYKQEFWNDTFSFLFGLVDKTKGILSYLASLSSYGTYVESHESNNEENIETFATNRYYQIEKYGNLVKRVDIIPQSISEKPIIFGIDDYIESKYVIAYNQQVVPTKITNSIYLEIGVDNTDYYLFGLIKTGSFEKLEDGSSYYSTNKDAKFQNNSETISSLDFYGDCAYYEFTPSYTGSYTFETTGNCDTYMYLYNSNGEQLTYNDDSGEGLNGRIKYTLNSGEKYFIKVKGYNDTKIGEFRFLIMYNIYDAINLTNSVQVEINNSKEFKLYTFTPTESGTYVFETCEENTDPQLYLYDSNFNQLSFNDDSGPELNSLISFNLEVGKTYYILAKCFSSKTGTFTLEVSCE